jgi:hypothetical protein
LNERKVVHGEPVIARSNPAAVLDLVEEALDQVAGPIKIRTEAKRLSPISFWWDVRPGAVGQPAASFLISIEIGARGKPVVMRLTGCQREPDRQAVGIDQRMNLAGQSTS